MSRFWFLFTLILHDLNPKNILEIGIDQGQLTRHLAKWCRIAKVHLTAIDTDLSRSDPINTAGAALCEGTSLEILPELDYHDVVFLDGDHNYYTVYNELSEILALANKEQADFPVVFLHDVDWPYGRRDMYYDIETVPDEHRHPHRRFGIMPDDSMARDKGLNPHLAHAAHSGGPKNGVRTAIEDFMLWAKEGWGEENKIRFIHVPGWHGLGIIAPDTAIERSVTLKALREIPMAYLARIGHWDALERATCR